MSLTQATVDNNINQLLPNASGITASNLRQILHQMNATVFQSIPPLNPPPVNSILNATSATSSAWVTNLALGSNGGQSGSLTVNGSAGGTVSLTPTSLSGLNVNQSAYGPMVIFSGPNATIANQISTVASITGNSPVIKATGSDTNVFLSLQGQGGSGAVVLLTPTSLTGLKVVNGGQFGVPTGGDKGLGTVNAAGSIYINSAPIEAGQRVTGTVAVTGSTSYSLSIPATASVLGVTAYTTVAFTASGSVTLSAGSAAGDTSYMAGQNIKAIGAYNQFSLSGTSSATNLASMPATSPNLFLTITQAGTPTNVGSCLIVVDYIVS